MPNTVRAHFGNPEIPPDRTALRDCFGISFEEPHGTIRRHTTDDKITATIGQLLILDDLIHVIPCHDLTRRQETVLTGAAEDAFLTPPNTTDPRTGWIPVVYDGSVGWSTAITVTTTLTAGCSAVLPFPAARSADPLVSDLA